MAVYKLFPSKDATLYSAYPAMNTGLDAILEVKNEVTESGASPRVSRAVIAFDQSEINGVIDDQVTGSLAISASLKAYVAKATGVILDSKLYAYAISGSWNNGSGQYLDGSVHDGTISQNYVRPSSDISKLGMMTAAELQLIYDEGITTIDELANAERPIIMKLRGGSYEPDPLDGPDQYRGGDFRFICPLKKRAESVVQFCQPPRMRIDGINDPCPSCAGSFEWDITTGLDLNPNVEYGGPSWEALIADAKNPDKEDVDGCNPPKWITERDPVTNEVLPRDEDDLLEEEMEFDLNFEIGGYQCVENTTARGTKYFVCRQGKVNLTCINLWSPRDFAASYWPLGRAWRPPLITSAI